jgi:hypothetical protein
MYMISSLRCGLTGLHKLAWNSWAQVILPFQLPQWLGLQGGPTVPNFNGISKNDHSSIYLTESSHLKDEKTEPGSGGPHLFIQH